MTHHPYIQSQVSRGITIREKTCKKTSMCPANNKRGKSFGNLTPNTKSRNPMPK
jgi:hypothetical protein